MQNEEIQKILNSDEKILWQGKPDKVVYALQVIFSAMIGIVVIFLMMTSFVSILTTTYYGFFIILLVLVLFLGNPIYRILLYPHIIYLITDKRIILQAGLIGRDFEIVDYDKVENATVNVGVLDKVVGRNTGTIYIFANRMQVVSAKTGATANIPFRLTHVTDPYTVFNFFKKTSFDIKADIHYPNALRPESNPGYQTDYNVPKGN